MRVLLIEEDARHCAHVRRRLIAWRPQGQLVVHSPVTQGTLAPEFLAQGFDAVLLNTAIAGAKDPVLMASAMKKAVEAGREAFEAGRMPRKLYASASSPLDGISR